MDDILVLFLFKLFCFVIIVFSVSVIVQEFNYDVNGFVVGLGFGGLVFVFVVKDIISNFFGGIIIIIEKLFIIGDWVEMLIVIGLVEDIIFRSMRFRIVQGVFVMVLNFMLLMEVIMNWMRMIKCQIMFFIYVFYVMLIENFECFICFFRIMFLEYEGVDNEMIMVNFDMFVDSYYNLFFNFYIKIMIWVENFDVREDINYKIIEIFVVEGVEFVYSG